MEEPSPEKPPEARTQRPWRENTMFIDHASTSSGSTGLRIGPPKRSRPKFHDGPESVENYSYTALSTVATHDEKRREHEGDIMPTTIRGTEGLRPSTSIGQYTFGGHDLVGQRSHRDSAEQPVSREFEKLRAWFDSRLQEQEERFERRLQESERTVSRLQARCESLERAL